MSDAEEVSFRSQALANFERAEETAKEFCVKLSLDRDLLDRIFHEDSDWAFIIQIDALSEAACRYLAQQIFITPQNRDDLTKEKLGDFVNALNMNGRVSLGALLGAVSVPSEYLDWVNVVRRLRNAYVHDITNISHSILDMIKLQSDQERPRTLRLLSSWDINSFDEEDYLKLVALSPPYLRFGVFTGAINFLTYAYEKIEVPS